MKSRSNYRAIDYDVKTRKTLNIGQFLGVDTTTPTFQVSSQRAIDMLNFIRIDETLEKRQGFTQILNTLDGTINNIWEYDDYIVVHCNTSLFAYDKDFNYVAKFENVIKNTKTDAFVRNERLYILTGIKFKVLYINNDDELQLDNVEDDAYIPTTTIGIAPNNLDTVSDTNRTSYDAYNNLTYWHINELTSGVITTYEYTGTITDEEGNETPDESSDKEGKIKPNAVLEYELDNTFNPKETSEVEDKALVTITYNRTLYGKSSLFNQIVSVHLQPSLTIHWENNEEDEKLKNSYLLYIGQSSQAQDSWEISITSDILESDTVHQYGSASYRLVGYIKGDKLVLFNNWGNYVNLTNNIEVKYPSYSYITNTGDYINKCTFGKIFTDQYSQNRLMVSGNEDIPNCDWWSDDVNVYALSDDVNYDRAIKSSDLIYFPSENYCYYGNDDQPLCGYDVESSGKLIVFKEGHTDTNIYFREGDRIYKSQDTTTGNYTYDYKLNMFAGNVGSYPVNHNCIVNFNGSTVYLANDKTFVGLEITSTIKDNTRYAYERAKYINSRLRQYSLEDLTNYAFLHTDNKYLYLVIKDRIFACRFDEYDSDTRQYERYILGTAVFNEGEYFSTMKSINNVVYIGTNKGNIFKWANDQDKVYEDVKKWFLSSSDFNSDPTTNISVLNEDLANELENGDRIYCNYQFIINNNLITITDKEYTFTPNYIERILIQQVLNTNRDLYIGNVKAKLTVDNGDGTFTAEFSENPAANSKMSFTQIKESDEVVISFSNDSERNPIYNLVLDDVSYPIAYVNIGQSQSSGVITRNKNINGVYVTAPMSFGTLTYYKNIYQFTLTNDTNKTSELYIATISNNVPLQSGTEINSMVGYGIEMGNVKDNITTNLNMFDFGKLAFTQDYVAARTFTHYRNIFRQRFTCFVLYNKKNTNAVISNLSFIYTITSPVVNGD